MINYSNKRYNRIIFTIILSLSFSSCISASEEKPSINLSAQEVFINNKIKSMTLEQMIGQLIIIGSDANNNSNYIKNISISVDSLQVGGICFFKGRGEDVIELNKKYSTLAKTPLLFSIDGEWGLGMRLSDGYSYMRQLTLGASDSDSLVYEMGKNIALQAKSLGIHINFAPTVDINLNPKNPVIGSRSFGEDTKRVSKLAWAYLKSMQDNGVFGSLKHFPGHGDTEVDSHHALPIINHSKEFIDSVDTYPFRYCIRKGARIVMIGHLNIPALIPDKNLPSSLSKEIITEYLKKEIGFSGIVITDALNMSGVTNNYKDGEAEVLALIAGVDILLMPKNEYKAVNSILKAIKDGRLTKHDIETKCRKVLNIKYELGLFDSERDELSLPSEDLLNQAQEISDKLAQTIITLAKNDNDFLPIIDRKKSKVAIVQLGNEDVKAFTSTIRRYNNADIYKLKDNENINTLLPKLEAMDYVVAVISGDIRKSDKQRFGITNAAINNLKILQDNNKTILALFANPYSLKYIDDLDSIKAVLVGYENTPSLQKALAKSLFGQIETIGRLPVTSSNKFKLNQGLRFSKDAMGYIGCVEADMNPEYFKKIDSIANQGIKLKAYPGCEIVVLHNNKVAYQKSYGYQTYDSVIKVNNNTIYDLASVTKIMATTIAMMKLFEQDKYSLDDTLSFFLPYLQGTNKSKITIREVLSHNSRLKAWEPFYKSTIIDKKLDDTIYFYNPHLDLDFYRVDKKIWIKKSYTQTIFNQIATSDLNKNAGYVYSDFGFILLGDMIQRITGLNLDQYLKKVFYGPMNLRHIGFNPTLKFKIKSIAPTEKDNYFRNDLIRGYVHDPAAAMMGGIAGHAGLFSNAMDVAKLCQMLLDGGKYNDQRYLQEATIKTFNKTYFKNNRRALGFDKPIINNGNSSPCSKYASKDSYGHTGFTGTYVWIEPKENLAFVFLSNRIYPSQNNNKLSTYNIRTNIHDLLYESIQNY